MSPACVESPPEYPAFIDDATGAQARVVSLSNENEELKRRLDELKAELTTIKEEVDDNDGTTNNVGASSQRTADGDSDSLGNIREELRTTQEFEVTAFTSGVESTGKTSGDPAYGITASGAKVAEGRTAACPPSMDFGTKVNIEGVGERVCEDRGSDITEGRLDVYKADLDEARKFGRQTLNVEILN